MIATDGAPSRGRVDDQYRQVSEPLQGKACQVRAIAIPMPWRIDIRTGVAAQVEAGDIELGLVLIALARGVVIDHHVDRRLGQTGIGLHTGDDLVAQLDKARHRQTLLTRYVSCQTYDRGRSGLAPRRPARHGRPTVHQRVLPSGGPGASDRHALLSGLGGGRPSAGLPLLRAKTPTSRS